jgi:hypothetical protein
MNIMAGSLGGLFPRLTSSRLEVVSIVMNNTCNLRCRHCYLEPTQIEPALARGEWLTFFHSLFQDLAPTVVSFAGKEIFTNAETANLVLEAIALRDLLQAGGRERTHIGLITNGTLLHRFQAPLTERPPDHFDVSIDGLPEFHDAVRGPWAFARLEPNLRWLVATFPHAVWVTHTVFAGNVRSIPQFIEFYTASFGLKRFSFGFYRPLAYTSSDLTLTERDRVAFIDTALHGLAHIDVAGPVDVVVEFGLESLDLLPRLQDAGWVTSASAISSTAHTFANGVTVRVNVCRVPVGLWRAVRVTPEGYWLAAEDLIDATEYARRAAVRLRDCGFDGRLAYKAGLEHLRRTTPPSEISFLDNIVKLDLLCADEVVTAGPG